MLLCVTHCDHVLCFARSGDAIGWSATTLGNARTSADPAAGVNASFAITIFTGDVIDGLTISYTLTACDLLLG